MTGWIKLHRKISENEIFKSNTPLCRRAAWIDILLTVNHQHTEMIIGNKVFEVAPGESLLSLDSWARRWRWNRSATRRFLKILEKLEMITLKNEHKTTRITVCKWASYQDSRNADETQVKRKRNASETQVKTNKNIKKVKNEKNEKNQGANFDFSKLAGKVGSTCARLLIEGEVGRLLASDKKPLLLRWLGYKFDAGNEVRTTQELFAIITEYKKHTASTIEAGIEKCFAGGWKLLVIDAEKNAPAVFPDFWRAGIEAERKYTPQQTIEYHRHLRALGYFPESYQGKTNWIKTKSQTRNGEAALSGIIAKAVEK